MTEQTYASARAQRWLLIVATALISAVAFEVLAVTTAMPTISRALDGEQLYAFANGGALVTQLATTALTGAWVDARGPRRPLLTGLLLINTGLIICTAAPSMEVLAFGRIIQGLGGGMCVVPLYVLVGKYVPPEKQSTHFAAFAAAWVLPSLIGPAIAGLLVDHAHWRWVFAIVPILIFALMPAIFTVLGMMPPLSGTGKIEKIRPLLLPALGAAGCALALYLVSGRQAEDFTAFTYLFSALAILGIGLSIRPLLPAGTLISARGLPSTITFRMVANTAFIGIDVYLPLLLQRVHGWSPTAAGATLTAGSIAWAAGSALQTRFALPSRRVTVTVTGAVILTAGMILAIPISFPSVPAIFLVGAWGLAGFGMGLAYPAVTTHALAISDKETQGRTSSALQIADTLGGSIGIAVAGILFAVFPGATPASFALTLSVLAVLGSLSILAASRIAVGNVTEGK